MKFGVFVSPQHPRSDDPVRRWRECLEQAIAARDVGFDAVAAGQHFLSPPYQSLQSLPLLARLAVFAGGAALEAVFVNGRSLVALDPFDGSVSWEYVLSDQALGTTPSPVAMSGFVV